MSSTYSDRDVFINCPFDDEYWPVFHAMIFAVQACEFVPRCASEVDDGDVRIAKILQIIAECRLGIHDISRSQIDSKGLPRFNMPLELGIFLGAREYGGTRHKKKVFLILERDQYLY